MFRFAPAASGKIHLGNLRVLLINFFYSKKSNSGLILRVDKQEGFNHDHEKKFADNVCKICSLFGVDFEHIRYQSQREDVYDKYFNLLNDAGYIYLNDNVYYLDIKKYHNNIGKKFIIFKDEVVGRCVKSIDHIDNVVIYSQTKKTYFYNFMSIVDDHSMKISYIIRGNDHIDNTYLQIGMLNVIKSIIEGDTISQFLHIPMCVHKDGKVSKSDKSRDFSVEGVLQKNKILPISLKLYLSYNINFKDLKSYLSDNYSSYKIPKSQKKICTESLIFLNKKVINQCSPEIISKELKYFGIEDISDCKEILPYIDNVEDIIMFKENIKKIKNGEISIEDKSIDNKNISEIYSYFGNLIGHKKLSKEYYYYYKSLKA